MSTSLPTCPTCGTLFHTTRSDQRYCNPQCRPSLAKYPSKRLHHCEQCGQLSPKLGLCSQACKHAWLRKRQPLTTSAPHAPRSQEPSLAWYQKDTELFAQRMPYTLNGLTWWATPCCYCGDPAEADEHVLPVSAFEKLMSVGRCEIPDDLLRIVPSCHECNSLLGDKVFRTFAEKRLYAKSALAHHYHEVLDYPHWEPEELAELSGHLRRWVLHGQGVRDLVFERLRF